MDSLYVAGDSWLHRLSAGFKLAALVLAGALLFLVTDWRALLACAVVAMLVMSSSGAGWRRLWRQLRGLLLLVLLVFVAVWVFDGLARASAMLFRLATLISLAMAVTLSTPSAALLDVVEWLLAPLDRRGWVDSAKVGLALSLTLRFIPEIQRRLQDIRDAQAARGIRANPVSLAVPLVVAILKSADAIAEAIDARGYPPRERDESSRR